jgi:hypothetical protein
MVAGTHFIDVCAQKCHGSWGDFLWVWSPDENTDIEWKRLSVFDSRQTGFRAIAHDRVRASAFGSNCTYLNACGRGAVVYGTGSAWTNASYLLIAKSDGTVGCFYGLDWKGVTLRQCHFVDNSAAALAGELSSGECRVEFCYFQDTDLGWPSSWSSWWGPVVVESCLFADAVPPFDADILVTGVQVSFTSTEVSFDTASLMPICGVVGSGLRSATRNASPTPTPQLAQQSTLVPTPSATDAGRVTYGASVTLTLSGVVTRSDELTLVDSATVSLTVGLNSDEEWVMSHVRVLSLTQREFSWSTVVTIRTHFVFAEYSKRPVMRGWSNSQIIGFRLGGLLIVSGGCLVVYAAYGRRRTTTSEDFASTPSSPGCKGSFSPDSGGLLGRYELPEDKRGIRTTGGSDAGPGVAGTRSRSGCSGVAER